MNGRHTIAFVVIAIIVACIGFGLDQLEQIPSQGKVYRLEIENYEPDQWIYKIYYGNDLKIKQEYVPGIPGNRTFVSEDQASAIGTLVLKRLQAGRAPMVTLKDLKKNGIAH